MQKFIEDQHYHQQDFTTGTAPATYENCRFTGCNFFKGDVAGSVFTGCRFEECDLSMVRLTGAAFRECEFIRCKMLGLRFETCNQIGLSFTFKQTQLSHACFAGVKMRDTRFDDCMLEETDFTGADLTGASFQHSNLLNAHFEHTNLEKCDFRNARNFTIDPEINRLKKAKFSPEGLMGLLGKYGIEV